MKYGGLFWREKAHKKNCEAGDEKAHFPTSNLREPQVIACFCEGITT